MLYIFYYSKTKRTCPCDSYSQSVVPLTVSCDDDLHPARDEAGAGEYTSPTCPSSITPKFTSYEKKNKTENTQISLLSIFLYVLRGNSTYPADWLGILHVMYLKHMTNS